MSDWLVVDIGNSALKAARFSGEGLVAGCRVDAVDGRCELGGVFEEFLASGPVSAAALASVVPEVTLLVEQRLRTAAGRPPLRIDANVRLPFTVAYETPSTLGADRIAVAAAAWAWRSRNQPAARVAIAVDAGTALNIEVVVSTARGPTYLGGVISPGPELLRLALRSGTAQLPTVPLRWPDRIVGSSTERALQAGILPGFVHAVDGIVQQIEQELGHRAAVIATGGWCRLLAEQLPRVDHADPDLVLRGIRDILALNLAG
jgi:type III pantothenate kinase